METIFTFFSNAGFRAYGSSSHLAASQSHESAMWAATIILPSVSWPSPKVSSPCDRFLFSVGSEPLDVLSERIWRSVGPSGRNKVEKAS
jgi:hypothetical protein